MKALLIFSVLWAAQDGRTPPPFEPPRVRRPPSADAPASPALRPGVLPADAGAEARELWQRVVRATRAPGRTPAPVAAFDLSFDLRVRRDTQRNDQKRLRFRYLAPGFVRATLESGREHLRGPEGDFLIDGTERRALTPTRENSEDRRQIDEELAIARNFVALTDPGSLRLAALRKLDAPPSGMPESLVARAATLDWLELVSPDFRLFRTEEAEPESPLYLARLGVERESGRPALACLARDLPRQDERALLVELQGLKPLDDWMLPQRIDVRSFVPEEGRFEQRPSFELGLRQGSLKPRLAPDDFRP